MYQFMYNLFNFPYIYPLKAETGWFLKVVKKRNLEATSYIQLLYQVKIDAFSYYIMFILYKTKHEGVRVLYNKEH